VHPASSTLGAPCGHLARGLLVGLLAGLLAGWLTACAPDPPPLTVEYAGCRSVLPGPVCVLAATADGPSRPLHLWVHTPPGTDIEITVDGRPLALAEAPGGGVIRERESIQGGTRFELALPATARRLEVRASGVWSLAFDHAAPPTWLAGLAGLPPEEKVAFLAERAAAATDPAERGEALRRLAPLRTEVDEARRDFIAAAAAFREAGRPLEEIATITSHAWTAIGARRLSEARAVLDSIEIPPGAPAEAACYLDFDRGYLAESLGDFRTAFEFLGKAADRAERLGLDSLRQDAEQILGWQLPWLGRTGDAITLFARLRTEMRGRRRPCDDAQLDNNYAWVLLAAREGGEEVADPIPLLDEAREIARQHGGCGQNTDLRSNLALNLALALLQGGRPGEARAALAEARQYAGGLTALEQLWAFDIEGRLALLEGRPDEALELYGRMAELAERASFASGAWQADLGRARAHLALGHQEVALTALAAAERRLDGESLRIPLGEGREGFVARRGASIRLYVERLLAAGREEEAFEVARRDRSRLLRALWHADRLAHLGEAETIAWQETVSLYLARRDELDALLAGEWQLPADELGAARQRQRSLEEELRRLLDEASTLLGPSPLGGGAPGDGARPLPPLRAGEVVLTFHPLEKGWVAFAATAGDGRSGPEVAVHRFELPPDPTSARPEDLARDLLLPFEARILAARRVRILPYGPLREIDFHALPFAGDVLLAARPVVYGLDLPAPPPSPSPPRSGRPGRALLLGDPRGDLPAARREIEAVSRALRGAWGVEILLGEDVSAPALRRRLGTAESRPDLLHYAGHGVHAGRGGWESALPLAGQGRLTAGDILALGTVPARVVLSGCETARSAPSGVESLGLAQAFLLAGARRVVAALRPVDDAAASELFADLYRQWGPREGVGAEGAGGGEQGDGADGDGGTDGGDDLASLLRQAQLGWRRQHPGGDWASFRVLEP